MPLTAKRDDQTIRVRDSLTGVVRVEKLAQQYDGAYQDADEDDDDEELADRFAERSFRGLGHASHTKWRLVIFEV